jgi:hypothetical protein
MKIAPASFFEKKRSKKSYVKAQNWRQIEIKSGVSVANNNSGKGQKIKTEVLTANYHLNDV